MSADRLNILANTLNCSKGTLPFTYLGLPLSITRPLVADFWPLVSKCERRLVAFSSFLNEAGWLQLTNVVLSALPTFAICTFLLPKTIINQIDKFRKHCHWRGADLNIKKTQKQLWWRDMLKLQSLFKSLAMVLVNNGSSCFLWHDFWEGSVCSQAFPELYSYAKNQHISLKVVVSILAAQDMFYFPLSTKAYTQFQELQSILQNLQLQQTNDVWFYVWGSTFFSSRKAYKYLEGHHSVHRAYRWLWKLACQNKRKFFFWLVLKDHLSTRSVLLR